MAEDWSPFATSDSASDEIASPSEDASLSSTVDPNQIEEEALDRALNAVVHNSLLPITGGLSALYLVFMFTHVLLLSMPNAAYISLMAAGSSVVLLLLRIILADLDPHSDRVHALGGFAAGVVLVNTLWSQTLTAHVKVMEIALLLVGSGFVFMSTRWFVGVLSVSILGWLGVTLAVHSPDSIVLSTVGVFGTAALGVMMHVVRRRTNLRAERLRLASEQQRETLHRTLEVKEQHRRSLEQSEAALENALADLQSTKDSLEQREAELSRMVDELTEAKEEAEKASQLKSAMLANMSHEVRTPLTSITGFAEVLSEESDGETQHFASLIHENSQRLLETLSSVLRLSKLEAGKQSIQREPVDLVNEAEALITEQSERAREAGVDLRLECECERCVCAIDRGAIQRILRNLVGNAIKFTEPGGEVVIRLKRIGDGGENGVAEFAHALLEVQDTGVGMSESFQQEMFKAFRQESEGVHSSHEGSGLGLSITERLVDLMGGTIEVESEKGEGTCFTIRLPREEDEANASVPSPPNGASPTTQYRPTN